MEIIRLSCVSWNRSDNEQTITKRLQMISFTYRIFSSFFFWALMKILLENVIQHACSRSTPGFTLLLAIHTTGFRLSAVQTTGWNMSSDS